MEALELILFLLVAVLASSLLDRFLHGVSLPLVQILLGAIIAVFVTTPVSSGIDAELLLILFIAPLHFNESRHVDSGEMWRNRWGIASLVTGLVLAIIISVGFTLHALVPAIPLAAALAVGAAMGSTDATAVTSLTKDVRFGKRHEALLAGEALFNDVTGTVGFQCAIAVVVAGAFSLTHAGEEFALELFGGIIVGAALGFAFWGLLNLLRKTGLENPTVFVVLELLIPFLIYLACEQIGVGGVIAVVASGMVISLMPQKKSLQTARLRLQSRSVWQTLELACEQIGVGGVIAVVASGMVISLMPQKKSLQTARLRLQSRSVWQTLEFVLNGVIFVMLGMQLPRVLSPVLDGGALDAAYLIACMVVLTIVLEGVRFLWVLGMDLFAARSRGVELRSCFTKASLKETLAMAFAGPKGGVTLSLLLTMPVVVTSGELFPMREEILSLASGVILCTLLLANFAVPRLVPHKIHEKRTRDIVDAEIALFMRVIASIQDDAHRTGAVTGEPFARTAAAHAVQGLGRPFPGEAFSGSARDGEGDAIGSGVRKAARDAESGETSARSRLLLEDLGLDDVDEPATAIVLKRYADRIAELAPFASEDMARAARDVVARCEEIYDRADEIADAVADAESDEVDGFLDFSARMAVLRAVGEAIDDVADQALARELEFIKEMKRAGELSAARARELRNDVYVQQMMID